MRKHLFGAVAGIACVTALVLGWMAWQPTNAAPTQASNFEGKVLGADSPISGSRVTLYAASEGKPTQLAQGKTGDDGTFKLDVDAEKLKESADKVLYLVARGGTPKAGKGPNDAIALMSVLGTSLPKTVTLNEFTTVASTFTAARSSTARRFPASRSA